MWGVPKMVGFPNNHGVFLLKMVNFFFWGGTTIFGNTHVVGKGYRDGLRVLRFHYWPGFIVKYHHVLLQLDDDPLRP